MTPSFLDGSHAYTPLRARLRSVATKAGVELEKSTVVLKTCHKLLFLRRSAFLEFDASFHSHTSQASSQRGICMRTVEKTRCHTVPVRARACFSTPERVENAELEVRVEGEDHRVWYKKRVTTKTIRLIIFSQLSVFIRRRFMLNWSTAGGTVQKRVSVLNRA